MLGKRGVLVSIALLIAAVLLAGQARLRLDDIVGGLRDDFEEMMYLPRGDGLKVLACGFDAPLADALFVKGMIYYADSFRSKHRDVRRAYTHDLFDVITELSPRFTRAYQMGALFLTASGAVDSNRDGIRLLEKGVRNYARMAEAGQPVVPDARWLFHTLIANTYETNIQSALRKAGDVPGAAKARRRAADEFRLAAASPEAPEYVAFAAAGIEGVLAGEGGAENSLAAVLSVWKYLRAEAVRRGDDDILPDLDARVGEIETQIAAIGATRNIEAALSAAGRAYKDKTGSAPADPGVLAAAGLVPGLPATPLGTEENPDEWLALPSGGFKSRRLALMDTANDLDRLLNAAIDYRKAFPHPPAEARELVEGGFIDAIPSPPLAELGQAYRYNPETGAFANIMPKELEDQ